jgi:hypothetical protein
MGSYRVGLGCAWCSRKAYEICNSLVLKKKLEKKYFSSHKLPKQQSNSFWSQGILGVKERYGISLQRLISTFKPCFFYTCVG